MNKNKALFGGVATFLALLALSQPSVGAARSGKDGYSGSNMSCLQGNDFYAVHFSAFQPGQQKGESSQFTKYCNEIPATGATYLSIDLLDRDTRKVPISLKVVEEEFSEDDGRPAKVLRTVAELPAKVYSNGTADIQANFNQPGHYALVASFGEDALSEDDHLRIPFTVAIEGGAKTNWLGIFTWSLAGIFYAAAMLVGYRTWRKYRPQKNPESEAGSENPVAVEAKVEAR